MLESLIKGNGSIHELNVEGAFPEQKPYQPRALYEALKRTPLYDAELGQWNSSISEGQELVSTDRSADAQLLGVLVEGQLYPQAALTGYETLKKTILYDPVLRQWNISITKEQEMWHKEARTADAQLLGVLVEAQFNPHAARKGYEVLKHTSLYDAGHKQWNHSMTKEEQGLWDTDRKAFAQLLGVLAEAQLNPQAAREEYGALKQTPFYDAVRKQWNWYMDTGQGLPDTNRLADIQLLGVLVEAQFNPEAARERYESLKQSPLYDSNLRQWNYCMSAEQELKRTYRNAEPQLLAILVELKLLASLPQPITRTIPPLPVIKGF